jgi:hypothetical protein
LPAFLGGGAATQYGVWARREVIRVFRLSEA